MSGLINGLLSVLGFTAPAQTPNEVFVPSAYNVQRGGMFSESAGESSTLGKYANPISFSSSDASESLGFRREENVQSGGSRSSAQVGGGVHDPSDEVYWKQQYEDIKRAYLMKKAQLAQAGGRRY